MYVRGRVTDRDSSEGAYNRRKEEGRSIHLPGNPISRVDIETDRRTGSCSPKNKGMDILYLPVVSPTVPENVRTVTMRDQIKDDSDRHV